MKLEKKYFAIGGTVAVLSIGAFSLKCNQSDSDKGNSLQQAVGSLVNVKETSNTTKETGTESATENISAKQGSGEVENPKEKKRYKIFN